MQGNSWVAGGGGGGGEGETGRDPGRKMQDTLSVGHSSTREPWRGLRRVQVSHGNEGPTEQALPRADCSLPPEREPGWRARGRPTPGFLCCRWRRGSGGSGVMTPGAPPPRVGVQGPSLGRAALLRCVLSETAGSEANGDHVTKGRIERWVPCPDLEEELHGENRGAASLGGHRDKHPLPSCFLLEPAVGKAQGSQCTGGAGGRGRGEGRPHQCPSPFVGAPFHVRLCAGSGYG